MRRTKQFENSSKHTPARFIAVDFFCGAGGTTRGLIDAGGYVIAGIDKDEQVEKTYQKNNKNRRLNRTEPAFLNLDIFPKTRSYPEGQQEELFRELDSRVSAARSLDPHIPLLFAICAPCQPFTTLSKLTMTEDRQAKRQRDSGLLHEALRFVEVYQPDYVLSENVAGIEGERYGGIWQGFTASLQELGYAVGSAVVDAVNFGVPQYRKRAILLGIRTKSTKKLLSVPLARPRKDRMSVRDAIAHFPRLNAGEEYVDIANHKTRWLSALNKQRISCAKPGESNAYMENTKYGDLSLPCHRRVNAKFNQRCFNDVYTRMMPDRPSPTITTKCHSISNGRFGHYDRRQNRGISLREAAALQSFPDSYVFHPADKIGVVARMIGNAVPPKLARFFANYLVSGEALKSLSASPH